MPTAPHGANVYRARNSAARTTVPAIAPVDDEEEDDEGLEKPLTHWVRLFSTFTYLSMLNDCEKFDRVLRLILKPKHHNPVMC